MRTRSRLHRCATLLSVALAAWLATAGVLRAQPVASATARGEQLYRLVETYAELGDHRTGTEVDVRTIDWFAAELERHGGRVERQEFEFPLFVGTSSVVIDGRPVPSLPLYYEAVGEFASERPWTTSVRAVQGGSTSPALVDAIAEARASGAKLAVVATENDLGELQVPNRLPKVGSGLPVVLVPGSAADRWRAGKVSARYSGKVEPGKSQNVIARFGDVTDRPTVIATPLSGWFRSAGERGTGIAVALALAEELGANGGLIVVGTSGHELLHHVGLETFLERHRLRPGLVVHLGANVAVGQKNPATGEMTWLDTRAILARMDERSFDRLRKPLAELGVQPRLNPEQWYGEAELWSERLDCPLVSFVGITPQFHTPADVPGNVTDAALLEQAYEAIAAAIRAYLVQE